MAHQQTPEQARETGRLEAFSDGVFAIAITLLVLELRVPALRDTEEGARLGAALRDLWPSYFAFATSFITILIMWVNHHAILRAVRAVDHGLVLLNGLLLMCVTFIPFPTAVAAEYLGHDGERLAVAFYSGAFVVTAAVFNGLWHYIIRRPRLLDPRVTQTFVRRFTRQYAPGVPLYLLGFALALVNAVAGLAVCFGLAVFFALPTPAVRMTSEDQ